VTREQVIEAAMRLGSRELTMTRVSKELGVSPGTLYQYVKDRDHLVELVAARRLGEMPIPTDVGQHWSDFLREYVHLLTRTLATHTSDLQQVLAVGSTLEPELRLADRFYASMVARGFSIEEAVEIMTQVSVIAIGTAMGIGRDRLAVAQKGSMAAAIEDVLATMGPEDDLPLVRRAAPRYGARTVGVERELVDALIARIALRRGE
jgi:AcrR family transcriptional regulator